MTWSVCPPTSHAFRPRRCGIGIVLGWISLGWCSLLVGQTPATIAGQADYFESRIRPILVEHCLACHGPDNPESDLRVDSRRGLIEGGQRGPAAVPGHPESSPMLSAVRHQSEPSMPPQQRLDEHLVKELENWIDIGMPWPVQNETLTTETQQQKLQRHRRDHWAFQPIDRPPLPQLTRAPWIVSPVDQLVIDRLAERDWTLSPPADRRTLIRRATFDLLGLPPTPDEVRQFVNNPDPAAYAQLIDRLLDSPAYGERWARHWLDVARYADTRGYTLDNADRNYPYAFAYRDYVIRALNEDLPYDQFIREQLAADQLDIPPDRRTLPALGFITVGRIYLDHVATVDDRVDAVTRGLMGLTVSCARCHDHKYDAIPTRDYYSLYGVFDNCAPPSDLPLVGGLPTTPEAAAFFDELAKREREVIQFADDFYQRLQEQLRHHLTEYIVYAALPDDDRSDLNDPGIRIGKNELNEQAIARWRQFLLAQAEANHPALVPLKLLLQIPDDSFAQSASKTISQAVDDPNAAGDRAVWQALSQAPLPKTKADVVIRFATLAGKTTAGSPGTRSGKTDASQHLVSLVEHPDSPARLERRGISKFFNIADTRKLRELRSRVRQHQATSPAGIVRAMTLNDNQPPHETHVMIRGNPDQLGDAVPRRFPAVLSGSVRTPFRHGAGRLELANAIASRDNPLTARVIANRIWMHHFSKPLVATPSDFGIRCPQPLQLPLLDLLASELIENDWSLKHLHRTIMLSRTYCQSSQDRQPCQEADPENQLLWKMNRRRLEFEALRDSVLAVAGGLDPTMGGPAVELFNGKPSGRRSIYGKIDRQDLPGLLRVFDFASPDQSAASRVRTVVPQQSLYMLNSPFIIDQARGLAARAEQTDHPSRDEKLERLYQYVFQRHPTSRERELAAQFLASPPAESAKLTAWEQLAQTLICSNEFETID